jgi:hypothetical protein
MGNWGHTIAKALSNYSETVEATTLTKFLEMNNIKKCNFMKLNCEGAEFPVLLSTPRETLLHFETILVLYHCDLWSKNTLAELLSHFQNSCFRTILRDQSENRGWIIATNNN